MVSEWNPFAIVRRAPRLASERQIARLSLVAAFSIGVVMFVGAVYGQARLGSTSSPAFVALVVTMWALWLSFTVYWAVSAWRFARLSGGYFSYDRDWHARTEGFDTRISAAERARRQVDAPLGDLLPSVHRSPRFENSRSQSGGRSGDKSGSSWRDAEARAARWLNRIDEGVVQGSGHRDGGIDVESIRYVVQVKDWNTKVGAPAVRETAGIASARDKRAVVISRSGFTVEATRFASEAGVALFQDTDGAIWPLNTVAETLPRTGSRRGRRGRA